MPSIAVEAHPSGIECPYHYSMVEATDDTPASMDKLGIQIPEHSSTASFGTTSEATIRTDVGIDRKIPYDDLLWSNYQKATSGLGFTPMNTPVHIPTSTLGLTTVPTLNLADQDLLATSSTNGLDCTNSFFQDSMMAYMLGQETTCMADSTIAYTLGQETIGQETAGIADSTMAYMLGQETTCMADSTMAYTLGQETIGITDSTMAYTLGQEAAGMADSTMAYMLGQETTCMADSTMAYTLDQETTGMADSTIAYMLGQETTCMADSTMAYTLDQETTGTADSTIAYMLGQEIRRMNDSPTLGAYCSTTPVKFVQSAAGWCSEEGRHSRFFYPSKYRSIHY
jgi:hypothetical protein